MNENLEDQEFIARMNKQTKWFRKAIFRQFCFLVYLIGILPSSALFMWAAYPPLDFMRLGVFILEFVMVIFCALHLRWLQKWRGNHSAFQVNYPRFINSETFEEKTFFINEMHKSLKKF